jgi:hypothetical protein
MFHPFAGFSGAVLGLLVFPVLYSFLYFTKEFETYNLDPQGKANAFEPFLAKYLRLGEFMIGLATGSIVLLVGSSALHGQNGHLPWVYASPLLLLSWCVLYGLMFMAWLILHYEGYQHGDKHTKKLYSLSETLGFSSLACFVIGYWWLIIAVTR